MAVTGQQHICVEQRRGERINSNPCGCLCWGGNQNRVDESARERNSRRDRRPWWRRGMGADHGDEGQIATRDLEGVVNGDGAEPRPDHLVILVNGIVGSANNWRFCAQRMRRRLGRNVAIHCSCNNAAWKTFDGVDVMGKRLAAEVRDVIGKTPSATRISFLGHSLGGLVSRYAIAELCAKSGQGVTDRDDDSAAGRSSELAIGGLRPENFITLATPHLGCKGAEQLPFLFGISLLERSAPSLAHLFVGRTGKHLFLNDGTDTEQPLLKKMATDCEEQPFLSSLKAFKRRTLYSNVCNDHMVGWRTSSIRLKSEKPDVNRKPVDPKYPHIIREEDPALPLGEDLAAGVVGSECKRGDDLLEEEMVAGLSQVAWHRVDVRFKGEKGSYQAHNLIQVKHPRIHHAGVDVIEHIIDKHFVADQVDEQSEV